MGTFSKLLTVDLSLKLQGLSNKMGSLFCLLIGLNGIPVNRLVRVKKMELKLVLGYLKKLTEPVKTRKKSGRPSLFEIKYNGDRKATIDNMKDKTTLQEIFESPNIKIKTRIRVKNSRIKHR